MKNLLSLAAVVGILASLAPAAGAEEFVARYTYLVNGSALPATTITQPAVINGACGTTLTQPALIDNGCSATVLQQPAVLENGCGTLPAVVNEKAPIMVQDHENIVPHILHIGLWPLVDFSIF